jgi:hypothetical protein
MNKFIKKIVFFVAILTFTNVASANDWPIFSNDDIMGDPSVLLDKPFSKEIKYTDGFYNYYLDLNSPYLDVINTIINNQGFIQLLPISEERSNPNEKSYFIYIPNNETNVITINRIKK